MRKIVFRLYVSEFLETVKTEDGFEISARKYVEWYVNEKSCRLFSRERKNEFSGTFFTMAYHAVKKSFSTPLRVISHVQTIRGLSEHAIEGFPYN